MITLYDSSISDILPGNLRTVETDAIAYAVNKQIQKIMTAAKKAIIVNSIDTADDSTLDMLACELRTQFYDASMPIEIKRNLVKNTIKWYTKSGTVECVEEMVSTIFGYGKVDEWQKYGGKPYHFRISADSILTLENMKLFSDVIRNVKNTRSVLDGFDKNNKIQSTVYYKSGMVRTKHIKIGG